MANNQQWTCDVLVIGAGPAGSTAARFAAQKGVKVILLERRERVGLPVRCAEYVPFPVSRYAELKESEILVQPVRSMKTYIKGNLVHEMTAPGFMIHRHRLDQALADQAVFAGAELKNGFRAWAREDTGILARGKNGPVTITCKIIIGADGPCTQVGRWMKNEPGENLFAAQIRVSLVKPLDHTRVYFMPYLFGGYGWLFPKGDTANVGIGIVPSLSQGVKKIIGQFKEERVAEGLIKDEVLSQSGGLVPVGGLTRIWKENMILAGDAARTCHPITGAGVGNALISGEMAGQAAAEAVRQGNLLPLKTYEQELVGHLGHSLNHALRKRKNLIAHWNTGDFSGNIHRNWIAFKEYHKG